MFIVVVVVLVIAVVVLLLGLLVLLSKLLKDLERAMLLWKLVGPTDF